MIGPPASPSCVKCGLPVAAGVSFCPNCGTQIGAPSFTGDPAETALPLGTLRTGNEPSTTIESAPTMGVTGAMTSLDSPSPGPRVNPGDGPFQAGQQVGPRYTILKLLGIGGMGAVYQAFDHELGVAVAIKVIRPGAQSDATAAKELELRFKRELVLARQVTHKYVVRIHDLGEINGIKYLTMPFVEGETLAQLIRASGPLPLERVITDCAAGRAGPRRRARERRRAPRPQARKHHDRAGGGGADPERRRRADHGLRHCAVGPARRHPNRRGLGDRHARIHGAGTGAGPEGRSARGSIRLRPDHLRHAGRPGPAVGPRQPDDRAAVADVGGAAGAAHHQCRRFPSRSTAS